MCLFSIYLAILFFLTQKRTRMEKSQLDVCEWYPVYLTENGNCILQYSTALYSIVQYSTAYRDFFFSPFQNQLHVSRTQVVTLCLLSYLFYGTSLFSEHIYTHIFSLVLPLLQSHLEKRAIVKAKKYRQGETVKGDGRGGKCAWKCNHFGVRVRFSR